MNFLIRVSIGQSLMLTVLALATTNAFAIGDVNAPGSKKDQKKVKSTYCKRVDGSMMPTGSNGGKSSASSGEWKPEYSKAFFEAMEEEKEATEKLLGATSKLPYDQQQQFCMRTNAPDNFKKLFWLKFVQALAKPESNRNHTLVARGPEKYGGHCVLGLVQMDVKNCKGMGVPVKTEEDLLEPKNNFRCFLKKAAQLMTDRRFLKDGQPVISSQEDGKKGLAAYWQPLKNNEKNKENGANDAKNRAGIAETTQKTCQSASSSGAAGLVGKEEHQFTQNEVTMAGQTQVGREFNIANQNPAGATSSGRTIY